jgi:hypothetical protein
LVAIIRVAGSSEELKSSSLLRSRWEISINPYEQENGFEIEQRQKVFEAMNLRTQTVSSFSKEKIYRELKKGSQKRKSQAVKRLLDTVKPGREETRPNGTEREAGKLLRTPATF